MSQPRAIRVLVVEDMVDWRMVLKRTLEAEGSFKVDTAENIQKARKLLDESFYHLIVLDIRMQHDDSTNREGMVFLDQLHKKHMNQAIKIVILSGHGTLEDMRDAFQGKVCAYFMKGTFNNLHFLDEIKRIITNNSDTQCAYPIRLDLDLLWAGHLSPSEAVVGLKFQDQRIDKGTSLQDAASVELEDLLCRLFYRANSVIMRRLTRGFSGAGVLIAEPMNNSGVGLPMVVKYGEPDIIHIEIKNFENYVRDVQAGLLATQLYSAGFTPHLGGIVYSFLMAGPQKLPEFGEYYQTASEDEVAKTIDNLFHQTCGVWYPPKIFRPLDLTRHYRQFLNIDSDTLHEALSKIKDIRVHDDIFFLEAVAPGHRFRNPVPVALEESFVENVYQSVTHGDLNERNVFVGDGGTCWLIDFRHTGPGHIMRDIASMETAIKLELLKEDKANLQERFDMEVLLNKSNRYEHLGRLAQEFPIRNPYLQKCFSAVIELRKVAWNFMRDVPNATMKDYYIALFYWTMNTLRFKSFSDVQRQQALLSASLISEHLMH